MSLGTHTYGRVRVMDVAAGSQAEKQGVRVDAIVKSVAGQSTEGLDHRGVVALAIAASRPLVMTLQLPVTPPEETWRTVACLADAELINPYDAQYDFLERTSEREISPPRPSGNQPS